MGEIEYNAAEAACYSELHPDAMFVLATDYAALEAEIQKFKDAYANDREIMAENVAEIEAHESRIAILEMERDDLFAARERLMLTVERLCEELQDDPQFRECRKELAEAKARQAEVIKYMNDYCVYQPRIREILSDTGAPDGPL